VRATAACALALLALAAGCGGDDDEEESPEREPAATAPTAPETTSEEPEPTTTEGEETIPPEEDDQGDPEAEEPVRSEAVFTAKGGRISPRRVEVPAYIAIRVELRPKDERDYSIVFEGYRMSVGGNTEAAFLSLDGLQPGDRYTGTASTGERLVISATAEPGP
jgi:hypothetical protein